MLKRLLSVISLPSLPSTQGPGDTHVQLQFGLFIGPSFTSQVNVIQIGSIQMPLHIHHPIDHSPNHEHPSQSSMLQFSELHYTSPISQGTVPVAPPSIVDPNMQVQNPVDLLNESAQGTSAHSVTNVTSLDIKKQSNLVNSKLQQPNENLHTKLDSDSDAHIHGHNSVGPLGSSRLSGVVDKTIEQPSGSQATPKSYFVTSSEGNSDQLCHLQPTMHYVADERNFSKQRGERTLPGSRERRLTYSIKTSNTRSYSRSHDTQADFNRYQGRPQRTVHKTEYRVRENKDKKQTRSFGLSTDAGFNDNYNVMKKSTGGFMRRGSKRGIFSNKTSMTKTQSDPTSSGNAFYQQGNYVDREIKEMTKESLVKSQITSHPDEANLRTVFVEDVDAPLQSGIVCIFKQSSIEAPNDDDDFIEVRWKRKMLNYRREQRKKEFKEKSCTNCKRCTSLSYS